MIEVRMKKIDWWYRRCFSEPGFFIDKAEGKRTCYKCRETINKDDFFLMCDYRNLCENCITTAATFIVAENESAKQKKINRGYIFKSEVDAPVQL